ncbi:MAG: Azurin [Opitutae bacterium]|nr:Azurin [Opitutae bacterium]|tara:strand:+ start:238 stop:678 length:441 start_codon:yes stop_codon:yes gene_type:complete
MKSLSCFIFAVASAGFLNADHKITITGNDTMQFDVKEFSVKAGAKVELTFKNIGKLPKLAMGHNLVILKEGISPLKFGQKIMGMGASPTNPLPKESLVEVIAATKLLGPGESEKLSFTAPKQAGLYQFLCSFPGHYAIMRGVMVVE